MAKKQKQKEQKLQTYISDYLKDKYPFADFVCDVAAGMRLSIFMAVLVKRWRSRRGLPDVYIFEPRGQWAMLMLELKADDASLHNKDGSIRKDKHLEEQAAIHRYMCNKGYLCMFTKGREHTKAVVDWYMSGAEGDPPKFNQIKPVTIFEN